MKVARCCFPSCHLKIASRYISPQKSPEDFSYFHLFSHIRPCGQGFLGLWNLLVLKFSLALMMAVVWGLGFIWLHDLWDPRRRSLQPQASVGSMDKVGVEPPIPKHHKHPELLFRSSGSALQKDGQGLHASPVRPSYSTSVAWKALGGGVNSKNLAVLAVNPKQSDCFFCSFFSIRLDSLVVQTQQPLSFPSNEEGRILHFLSSLWSSVFFQPFPSAVLDFILKMIEHGQSKNYCYYTRRSSPS